MSDDLQSGKSLETLVEISREELERMRGVQEKSKHSKGVGMLFEAYIESYGSNVKEYLRQSKYVSDEGLFPHTVATWFRGSQPFRLKHMKGLVDELRVNEEHLHFVAGRNPFEPTEEELEEWSNEKGFFKLFSHYVDLRHGLAVRTFILETSKYVEKEKDLTPLSVYTNWVRGISPFPLKHLKGIVDELKIPDNELEKVCGRNPFKPTEEELEEWSRDEKGVKSLFNFYIDLNYGDKTYVYLKNSSDYTSELEVQSRTVLQWVYGLIRFPPNHLKGLAEEIGIPPEHVKRVTGVDIDEVKSTAHELTESLAGYLVNE